MDGDEGLSASLIFPDGAPTWQCPECRAELRSAICLACFVRRLLRGKQLRKIYGTSDGPLAGLELREPELSRYSALRAAGRRVPRRPALTTTAKHGVMRGVLRTSPPPGWRWETMLEACDIGLVEEAAEAQLGGRLGRATQARPGSQAKLNVLIARAAVGVELWHPEDRTLF